jgi:PPP family 3-phenylpropionic acid transporter
MKFKDLTIVRPMLMDLFGHWEAYPLRALYFFTWVGTSIAGNFIIVTLRHDGFSGKEIAAIATVGPLFGFFVQPFWGFIADRFGRRRCLSIGILISAAIYFRMYWVHGFWPFLLTAMALALSPPLQPLMDTLALDFVESKSKLSYGMFRIWGAIAAGVGAAGAGFLIEGQPVRTAFLWATGGLLTAGLFTRAGKSAVPHRAEIKGTRPNFASFVHNTPLVSFLVVVIFFVISSTAFWNFNGVYYTDIGGTTSFFGLAIAIAAVAEIPFYFLAAPIIRRFGLGRVLLFTFICAALRAFSYAFISNPRIAIWIELSNGVSWTLFWVAAVEYVNQLVKPEVRATGQVLLNASCWGAGTILGIQWNGFLLDFFKPHFLNSIIQHAIQKVCFTSGFLLVVLTIVSALVLKIGRQGALAVTHPHKPLHALQRNSADGQE